MAHNVWKTIALASGVSTILMFAGFSSQAFAMSPFQASYQFEYNGKNMGSATRTLSKSGNNWTYVFVAKAGAMASATETSHFSLNDEGHILSNSFIRHSKVLVHNNSMSINFNPSAKIIHTKKDKQANSFAWVSGALDELNAELQLREDLKASDLKSSYPITDAKGVELRRFIKQDNEQVTTFYGTFDTIKVVMKHNKPDRDTIFWLAPKLDYAPVKVFHQDGKTSYGLLLTGYKGITNQSI